MHRNVYRLPLTHIFFAVPSSICSECARCACFEDRFRRSDAFLDEPRLSFSRVRRGYCSRTNPIDRKTRVASRRGVSALYIVIRPRCYPDRSRRISGITKICYHWLPPHVRYHESVLSCTVLRICSSRLPAPALASSPGFSFFLSISLSVLLEFARWSPCSLDSIRIRVDCDAEYSRSQREYYRYYRLIDSM